MHYNFCLVIKGKYFKYFKYWMDGWMDGWKDGRTDGRTDWLAGWLAGWLTGWLGTFLVMLHDVIMCRCLGNFVKASRMTTSVSRLSEQGTSELISCE